MKRDYSELNNSERKLQKFSIISFGLLYGPLFGYSLNKDAFYFWLILAFIGSISLLFKLRLIKPEIRIKIGLYEIILTVVLIVWIFSEAISVPMIIKQFVFFVIIGVAGYKYFKLMYDGKLAIESK
ncbi:hypothetical protein ET33_31330 [Paenibacillus tyrfis]|uniref:Uncharacterized protein n=1 Tax=Paenibacillus tyrfis TaxID=1501230 RepID=A0A081P6N8_9BACL|nr:hypothetical protein ET33_31330 [Paenibacillus tyrfis]